MESRFFRRTLAAALVLAALPMAASHAANQPLKIEVQTSPVTAVAGTRASVALAVIVTVADGTPLPALGNTILPARPGDRIELPSGWDLYDIQIQPPGCPWVPTAFYNLGKGRYLIHLVPDPNVNGTWEAGTYLKSVQLDFLSGNDRLQGSALAALTIP